MHLSPCSSSRSGGHNQSQWLHKTLSDLNTKMKSIIKITAESYGKGKPELIQMLEELHRSYQSLAEENDQLRSKLIHFPAPGISSSSRKFLRVKSSEDNLKVENYYYDPELEIVDFHSDSVVEDHDSEFGGTNLDHECLAKIADELKSSEQSNKNSDKNLTIEGNHMTRTINSSNREDCKEKTKQTSVGEIRMDSFERENTWSDLKSQVTKLMEENIKQQAELLRRNAEKREAIKELRLRLECMKAENRALQTYLNYQNQKSRLKRQFSLKFLGCS